MGRKYLQIRYCGRQTRNLPGLLQDRGPALEEECRPDEDNSHEFNEDEVDGLEDVNAVVEDSDPVSWFPAF